METNRHRASLDRLQRNVANQGRHLPHAPRLHPLYQEQTQEQVLRHHLHAPIHLLKDGRDRFRILDQIRVAQLTAALRQLPDEQAVLHAGWIGLAPRVEVTSVLRS